MRVNTMKQTKIPTIPPVRIIEFILYVLSSIVFEILVGTLFVATLFVATLFVAMLLESSKDGVDVDEWNGEGLKTRFNGFSVVRS
jgi:hypothetical protein